MLTPAPLGPCKDWLHIERCPLAREGARADSVFRLVKNWIQDCNAGSKSKWKVLGIIRDDRKFLPTRLLYVGQDGADEAVKLVETKELYQHRHQYCFPVMRKMRHEVQYACFSYCWGSHVPLKTTRGTLAQFKRGLPKQEMPQSFQDAIFVTRKLGLQYLWIDALCILQDMDEDWEAESAMMSDIFFHSFITIGAAATASCLEGFLRPRKDRSLTLKFQSSLSTEISGSYSIHLSKMSEATPCEVDMSRSVWTTRGWVWQEQILPQRLLIFGEEMVHLKCRCYRRIFSEDDTVYPSSYVKVFKPSPFDKVLASSWQDWIQDFSCRALTHPRDSLAAVAGLARALERAFDKEDNVPEYLAGHWLHEEFDSSLLWILQSNRKGSFRAMIEDPQDSTKYCAPSWSWASRHQGGFGMLPFEAGTGMKTDFKFICSDLMPAKSNPRVGLKPGSSITLQGRVRPMSPLSTEFLRAIESSQRCPNSSGWMYRTEEDLQSLQDPVGISSEGGTLWLFLDWNPRQDPASCGEYEASMHLFLLTDAGLGLVLLPDPRHTSGYLRVGAFVFESSAKGRRGDGTWTRSMWIIHNQRTEFLRSGWTVRDVKLY